MLILQGKEIILCAALCPNHCTFHNNKSFIAIQNFV
jgi:hypothetical protein